MKLKAMPPAIGSAPSRLAFAATDEQTLDARRRVFNPMRKSYSTARWKRLRIATFERDKFQCCLCKRIEGNTSRLVCDHIQPHRGDEQLFWSETNLQTLCKPCHDSTKQSMESATR